MGRRGRRAMVLAVVVLLVACSSPTKARRSDPYPLDDVLRLNEVQVLGTHNSYHRRPAGSLPGEWTNYEHPELSVQLEQQGVRSVELDVSNSPDFPVEHDPYFDDRSNCSPLADCLEQMKRWSDGHPGHIPIFVLVEPKDPSPIIDVERDSWDAASLKLLDDTVREILGDENLVTPDDVRGKSDTLRQAVRDHGWPKLEDVRGKFVVVLNRIKLRRTFIGQDKSLEGKAMFVIAYEFAPSAAFIEVDQPKVGIIRRLVRNGFIVRTRADAEGVEVQAEDTRRSQKAIDSGAQIISTDYPVPDLSISSYVVQLPNGRIARCNPVNAPKRCRAAHVENPRGLLRR